MQHGGKLKPHPRGQRTSHVASVPSPWGPTLSVSDCCPRTTMVIAQVGLHCHPLVSPTHEGHWGVRGSLWYPGAACPPPHTRASQHPEPSHSAELQQMLSRNSPRETCSASGSCTARGPLHPCAIPVLQLNINYSTSTLCADSRATRQQILNHAVPGAGSPPTNARKQEERSDACKASRAPRAPGSGDVCREERKRRCFHHPRGMGACQEPTARHRTQEAHADLSCSSSAEEWSLAGSSHHRRSCIIQWNSNGARKSSPHKSNIKPWSAAHAAHTSIPALLIQRSAILQERIEMGPTRCPTLVPNHPRARDAALELQHRHGR